MLTPMMIFWAVITVVLAGLSIYRSILVMYEDDQLFIGSAEAALAAEYAGRLRKIQHVETVLKVFTVASGALFLATAGLWFYRGIFG
jgi:hypothetical protein